MNLKSRLDRLEDGIGPGSAFIVDTSEDYARAKEVFGFVTFYDYALAGFDAALTGPSYEMLIKQGVIIETERYRSSRRDLFAQLNQNIHDVQQTRSE